jgi:hypothetical protein
VPDSPGDDARVHRVASLLKRWLMGTHQGAVSHDHSSTTLANSRSFYRLAQQAVIADPVPYKSMVKYAAGAADQTPT